MAASTTGANVACDDTPTPVKSEILCFITSAVNVSQNVLVGRPYGGAAILYNKKVASCVTVIDTLETRCMAIVLHTNMDPC